MAMKKLTAAIVLAWTAIVVAAEAMEPVVPVMWRRGAVEETARDLREIRAKSGLSRFFVAGPGFNEVMYATFATNLYAEMGREIGEIARLVAPPPALESGVLTTGPPGKSPPFLILPFWEVHPAEFTHNLKVWRRKWQPTPVFLPGDSQGQGSLVGCRLWGRTPSTHCRWLLQTSTGNTLAKVTQTFSVHLWQFSASSSLEFWQH